MTVRLAAAAGLVLAGGCGAAQSQSAAARAPDVHFVPTRMEVVTAMLKAADVGPNDVVYDLGSGDGRIVITAASRHGARGIGIDIDPERIAESNENADSAGVTEQVTFRQADLFESDLRPASVVTLYLLPSLNLKVLPKLYRELRPGTRIVSNGFDMGDWKPDSTIGVPYEGGGSSTVYYWVLPADASGGWTIEAGGRDHRVRFTQRYQALTGTATSGGQEVPLENARLLGDRIQFELGGVKYRGTVSGDRIRGTSRGSGGREVEWTAVRRSRGAGPVPRDSTGATAPT